MYLQIQWTNVWSYIHFYMFAPRPTNSWSNRIEMAKSYSISSLCGRCELYQYQVGDESRIDCPETYFQKNAVVVANKTEYNVFYKFQFLLFSMVCRINCSTSHSYPSFIFVLSRCSSKTYDSSFCCCCFFLFRWYT